MSVRRDTIYNIAGALIPLGVTVITLPPFIATIGEARYGVLAILWTMLGYFGLFDLGIGRAVTNKIAALRAAPQTEREDVFWTALGLNAALGLVGALLFWGVGYLILTRFVGVPTALTSEVTDALPWMVLAFPLILVSGVCSGALQGREEFLVQNAITVAGAVFAQIVPLAVAMWIGPTLPLLVAAVMVVRVLSGIALFGACRWQMPLHSAPRLVRAHVRPLFSYGGWITVSSIVGPLLTTLDRVFIGIVVGARAVTYYAVPFNMATRVTIVPGSLSKALFPRFSAQHADVAGQLLFRATRLLLVVMLPLILVGFWMMEPFLSVWMGKVFASRSAPTGQWLVVGLWLNVCAYPAFESIPARGRPDLVAKLQLAQVGPYLPCLWFALERFGVAGGAAVWAVRNTVDAAALIWLAGTDARIWPLIGQSFVLLCLGVAITLWTVPLSAAAFVGLAVLLALTAAWAWRVDPDLCAGALRRLGVWRVGEVAG